MSFGDYSILFQKHSSFTFGYDKYLTYYNQQNVGLVESKKGPSFPDHLDLARVIPDTPAHGRASSARRGNNRGSG